MALNARQKMFFFVGLNIALYGLCLIVLGAWHLDYTPHGAAGVSMWCGIILIMCGVGDVIISIDCDDKDYIGGFSIGAILANMIAVFVGIAVIGFSTWAAWDDLDIGIIYGVTESAIEIYVTVVLLGAFSMILALVALMFDCCCNGSGLTIYDDSYPERGYPAPAGVYPYPPQYR
ncbi:uncharacterized protein [Amphiura filiformis]|uniref:uncharacterized protein n=1 Tax=Amphiura filiformis TaxID=82378 RepID=UPI003B21A892